MACGVRAASVFPRIFSDMALSLENTGRLLVSCPDHTGIIAAVSEFLYRHGANCTALDQYATGKEGGASFMRVEFQAPGLAMSRSALEEAFAREVAERFAMDWRLSYASDVSSVAILVSRHDHVLMDLLSRMDREDWRARVAMVISNHPDLEREVARFGVPYYHVPMPKGGKREGEARMLELMGDEIDVIVLARYMQILSGSFVDRYVNRIINIHHSFLPAFAGADPYRQASDRGVKLIGATAHYVTEELDKGAIIDQDVVRVNHRQSPEDLRRLGRDVERSVLARAVRLHLEDRLIVHENKTVVFD